MKKDRKERKENAKRKLKEENLILLGIIRDAVIRKYKNGKIEEDRMLKITRLLNVVKEKMEA